MVLKVTLVMVAALSLVSCLNIGNMAQNARKHGVHIMKIDTNGAGGKMSTTEREGEHSLNIFEKEVVNSLKIAEDVSFKLKSANPNSPCSCVKYTCRCCLELDAETVSLKRNESLHMDSCVGITYLPNELGLELVVTIDGDVIIDEKISVQNPPPICATVPFIHLASLCIRLYDLKFDGAQFSGCVDVEIKVLGIDVVKVDLGCIHIPPNEKHLLALIISE